VKKRVLVLNANPKSCSFCEQLAEAYAQEAHEQGEVRLLRLSEMDFNPDLKQGYDAEQPLEPALVEFQQALRWAEHLVICTPIWWGGIPAKFKGLLDRILLPGFAFNFEPGNPDPIALLSGKSARIIMTMDAPPEYYVETQDAPALKQLELATLRFCGLETVEHCMFGPVITSDSDQRVQWLSEIRALGSAIA